MAFPSIPLPVRFWLGWAARDVLVGDLRGRGWNCNHFVAYTNGRLSATHLFGRRQQLGVYVFQPPSFSSSNSCTSCVPSPVMGALASVGHCTTKVTGNWFSDLIRFKAINDPVSRGKGDTDSPWHEMASSYSDQYQ